MAPKKETKKLVKIDVEVKKEIIKKHEDGVRVSALARQYGKATSTICTILKDKDKFKSANVAKGVKVLTKQRPKAIDDVEKLLLVWINERQLVGDSISEQIICEKARVLYADLIKQTPGTSDSDIDSFKASRGWFEKFKKRSGIHNVVRHGEAASSDKTAAERYITEFQEFIDSNGYLPQQVFNCDETGLFWKKMPRRTYITQEEKTLPGHKPMKDRLTLLLCANASGDFKLKPLLVYHSENPRVFKQNNVIKSNLGVMWRANRKAWVTRQFFIEWMNKVAGPTIKKYLTERSLPLKAVLVLDNAPAHPPDLEDSLIGNFDFITIKFLPPNTTPLLQPMDQQVIANFKKLYTKALFQRCFEVTTNTQLTLIEFWKKHFHILSCLTLIEKAWQDVTQRTLNSAWRKLWSKCVQDFEPVTVVPVVEEIVALGQTLGLEIDDADVEELVEEHRDELSTDELQSLLMEQQQEAAMDMSSGNEEQGKHVSSTVIKEMCNTWEKLHQFVEETHPDKAVASRAINIFNDSVMSHFRQVLKRRERQIPIDQFLIKMTPATSQSETADKDQAGPSESKPTQ